MNDGPGTPLVVHDRTEDVAPAGTATEVISPASKVPLRSKSIQPCNVAGLAVALRNGTATAYVPPVLPGTDCNGNDSASSVSAVASAENLSLRSAVNPLPSTNVEVAAAAFADP